MLRPFLIASALLCAALLGIVMHAYIYKHDSHSHQITQISRLSNIHVISLSTSPHETRLRWYEEPSNIAYPELLAIDTMGYIYE